jgi:hypothetical protein
MGAMHGVVLRRRMDEHCFMRCMRSVLLTRRWKPTREETPQDLLSSTSPLKPMWSSTLEGGGGGTTPRLPTPLPARPPSASCLWSSGEAESAGMLLTTAAAAGEGSSAAPSLNRPKP